MSTLTFTSQYTLISCGADGCDISFAVPDQWLARKKADQSTWTCPNGHRRHFTGETELQRTKRQLENAREQAKWARTSAQAARDQAAAAERSARAYKGVATRVKRRAAHGVCPCCTRTFADVARHMAGQHPAYVAEHGPAHTEES